MLALNVIVHQEAKIQEIQKERNLWKLRCKYHNADPESIAELNRHGRSLTTIGNPRTLSLRLANGVFNNGLLLVKLRTTVEFSKKG